MIILKRQQFDNILDHSLKSLPNEACGLIGGRIEGDLRVVEKVYLLSNADNSPEHFSIDPKEQFGALKDIRNNNWEVLGNFHSHPTTPSRPSNEDIRLAFDPNASYLILSLIDVDNTIFKSFRIQENKVNEEEIKIIGEE